MLNPLNETPPGRNEIHIESWPVPVTDERVRQRVYGNSTRVSVS